MTTTVVMELADRVGRTMWKRPGRYGTLLADRIDRYPTTGYALEHRAPLPIEVDHNGPHIGHVTFLGIEPDGSLVAVGVADDVAPELFAGTYASADVNDSDRRSVKLKAVAVVDATARMDARPIQAIGGDYRDGRWNFGAPAIVQRARAASDIEYRSRWTNTPLRVHQPPQPEPPYEWGPIVIGAPDDSRSSRSSRSSRAPARPRTVELPDGTLAEIEHINAGYVVAVHR